MHRRTCHQVDVDFDGVIRNCGIENDELKINFEPVAMPKSGVRRR